MITHIGISDLHAGAPNSLIMPLGDENPADPQPVTVAFAAALQAFLGAAKATPKLMVLGDLIDLQFSNRTTASQNAVGFLKEVKARAPLSDTLIATAGNHDHAIWSDARLAFETRMLTGDTLPIDLRDATPAFSPSSANSRMLDAIADVAGFQQVDLRYPNIGFHANDRIVQFHHGHFVEGVYRAISSLRDHLVATPRETLTVAEIARENAGWIDFLWPSIGDAGFGDDASEIYQNLLTTAGFRHLSSILTDKISGQLSAHLPLSGNLTVQKTIRIATQVALDLTLGQYRDTERYTEVTALTDDGREGVQWYLEGPVLCQIADEDIPLTDDVTFVFGHTHKPFAERLTAAGFPGPVKAYNTGGWTLNGPRLDNAEGASLVLMNETLDVANLRIFGTPHNGKIPDIQIDMLDQRTPTAKAFFAEIARCVAMTQEAWAELHQAVGVAYRDRQAYLLDLTAHGRAAQ